jgi:hypothetical protein
VDVLANGVKVGKRIIEIECEDKTAILLARSKAATCQGAATMPERGGFKWGQKACPCEPIVFGGRYAPLSQGIVSRSDIPKCNKYRPRTVVAVLGCLLTTPDYLAEAYLHVIRGHQ